MGITNQESSPFDSPEVRVVEASAGSGKTYALAKRYVQLVLSRASAAPSLPIRNILALTFTNKAAFEMKARILEFLKLIALNKLSTQESNEFLAPLGITADQASHRAFTIMDGIIRHYNFFQVQTIDKFINALLSGCSFKIGLTANFKIQTNSRDYLQSSLDRLIDRAREDKDVLGMFEQFLHHYIYLENRSGWFPKDDILAIMTTLFEQNNTYGAVFEPGPYTQEDVIKKKRMILRDIQSLKESMPTTAHAGFVKSVDKFLEAAANGIDIDRVSDYFARDILPVKKGSVIPDDLDKLWRKIRSDIKQLCHAEAYSLFNPYIQMYAETMEGFKELAVKDDCLFLNELNKRASTLFTEQAVTVEELYYRLATRFHHYLVDEFQDTSRLQWANLEQMVREALSTGGTLFYVGDRKQAIYGFRGGDAGLFDDIKQAFKPFNVHVDQLANNYRSRKSIVEFNNAVFSTDNLDRFIREKRIFEEEKNKKAAVGFTDDEIRGVQSAFDGAHQTAQQPEPGGYVQMRYIDLDKKEERDEVMREQLITLIGDLSERMPLGDIAILTRNNLEVKRITQWLLEAGIPVESERTSDITENHRARELIAFLIFLNSPIDNCAFADFILGDLFARATGLKSEDMHDFIFGLRNRLLAERDLYLYIEFREHYPVIWKEFIEEFFVNVGLYPLYELIVTIYKRFDVLSFKEDQGFLMHFLEIVKGNEEEHGDVRSFLDYFEQLQGEASFVHIADSDAVRLLTVHKSKGLEFPAVILPYLGMDIQIGARSGEYQPSYILRQDDGHLTLLRLKQKYRKFSGALDAIYSFEYKQAFLNELNNIYVALTRAKNELYGFIPKKIGTKNNFARFLIPEDSRVCGEHADYPPAKKRDRVIDMIPPAQYPDWIDYLRDEFHPADDLAHRQARLDGELMHSMLEQVGNLSDAGEQSALERALQALRSMFPEANDQDEHFIRLRSLIHADGLKPYFYCEDAEVFTEKEMVNRSGHTKRCDRLIIRDGECTVVDYKSSREHQDRDREQVKEYMQLLKEVYPSKDINGTIIYMDTAEAEVL